MNHTQRAYCLSWALAIALLMVSCQDSVCDCETLSDLDPTHWSAAQIKEHLMGTWERVDANETLIVKKTLVLDQDGQFSETTVLRLDSVHTETHLHSGTWFFDGVNLKRKYEWMDGHAPSRLNSPFATFEIHFSSQNDFEGIDHIHHNRIRYARVS